MMKNLILIKNLNLPKRTLTTTSQKCKYISPYDNPMPKDVNANNVFKLQKWQRVNFIGKGMDKEISKLQSDDHFISNPTKAKYLANTKLRSFYDSIKTKGFARECKTYQPPEDLKERFDKICMELFGEIANEKVLDNKLDDSILKYKLIVKCIEEFNHELPNSDLHLVKNVNNVLTFYSTPVRGINSLDSLTKGSKLPKNLYVVTETVKFNPDTDTFFDGYDAFPKKAIINYGIKESKKYDNFKTQIHWPDI